MGRTRGQSLAAVDGYGRMAAVGLRRARCAPRWGVSRAAARRRLQRRLLLARGAGPSGGLSARRLSLSCPASSSTWRRSKTSSVVFPSVFAAPRMIPVAPQRASPSHASRHGRRVSRSTGCARRSGEAARAALEGLPPAGDALEGPAARRDVRDPQPKRPRGRPGVRGPRRPRQGPGRRAQSADGRGDSLSRQPPAPRAQLEHAILTPVFGFRPIMNELWSILVARWRRRGLDSEPATSAHDPSTPHGLPYESAGRGGGYTGTGKATPGRGLRPCARRHLFPF